MIEQIGLILLAVSLNGFLSADGTDYQITHLDNTKIIAKGVLDNEIPFACITKCFMLVDGDLMEATYKEPLPVDTSGVNYNVDDEKISSLDLVVTSRNTFTQWWDDVFIHVNTKTPSDVTLKITGPNGTVKELTQKTNLYGFIGFSFRANHDFGEGFYIYTVTAKDGQKTLTDSGNFWVIVKHNTG